MEPRIKTTVVGSYPIPVWLASYPTTPNLHDAVLVVTKIQELAGVGRDLRRRADAVRRQPS